MPGKDIGFVHIDEETCEDVIDQMENCPFNGGKMKISYGQIGTGLFFVTQKSELLHFGNLK